MDTDILSGLGPRQVKFSREATIEEDIESFLNKWGVKEKPLYSTIHSLKKILESIQDANGLRIMDATTAFLDVMKEEKTKLERLLILLDGPR